MRKIDTLDDLRREKVRLKIHLKSLETQMHDDVEKIKHSLRPAHLVMNKLNSLVVRENNGLMNLPINGAVDFIFRKIILRNSGFLLKLLVPFVAKNVANNYFSDKKGDILSWLGDKVKGFLSRNKHDDNNHQENKEEQQVDIAENTSIR